MSAAFSSDATLPHSLDMTPSPASGNCASNSCSHSSAFVNSQIKFDCDQQSAIKLQQFEAIRLIQISLDKLASATTVPLPMPANQSTGDAALASTVFVYKDTNLHKNLLVSKILNKAKYCYYQSIVQSMRFSLMSKLNYYSALIQQLNASQSEKKLNPTDENNNNNNNDANPKTSMTYDESSIIEEMKLLMQQIWQETYQFNLNNSFLDPPFSPVIPGSSACLPAPGALFEPLKPEGLDIDSSDTKKTATPTEPAESSDSSAVETEQMKRIKQLNDVKLSLYSLLFNPAGNELAGGTSPNEKSENSNTKPIETLKRKRPTKQENQDEVVDVVTVSAADSIENHFTKKPKNEVDVDENCCTAKAEVCGDVNSTGSSSSIIINKAGHADILNDDTNVIKNKTLFTPSNSKDNRSSKTRPSLLYDQNDVARNRNNMRLLNRSRSLKSPRTLDDGLLETATSSSLASMAKPGLKMRPNTLDRPSSAKMPSKLLPSISKPSAPSPGSFINLEVLF